MKLTILYKDGTESIWLVKRASNLSSKTTTPYLYYERHGDLLGQGTKVHMEDVLCWEVEEEDD